MAADLKSWASKYKTLTDNDPTIGAMAKYYTCTFLFDMGEAKVIVEMHDGKVKNINTNPGPLDPYDFALRASPETWREFAQPYPKPMYPRHLVGELPAGSQARRQPPRVDAEPPQLYRAVRAAAQGRRAGLTRSEQASDSPTIEPDPGAAKMARHSPVTGRYVTIDVDGLRVQGFLPPQRQRTTPWSASTLPAVTTTSGAGCSRTRSSRRTTTLSPTTSPATARLIRPSTWIGGTRSTGSPLITL